jgi:diaminopimelate epimerase
MSLNYRKYHGCLNEFICVDLRNTSHDIAPYVPGLCQKKTWPPKHLPDKNYIGADGLVGVHHSDIADFKMQIINANGSIPEMCGNGLRCFVAFLHHQHLTQHPSLRIETGAGVLAVTVHNITPTSASISVGMGKAKTKAQLPNADFLLECQTMDAIPIGQYNVVPVSMGNPHAVIYTSNINGIDINTVGPLIQNAESASGKRWFPNGINVEFLEHIPGTQRLYMRVFERGVGETMACGTGACAAVVAGMLHGHCQPSETVFLKGGELTIDVNPTNYAVTMQGPAQFMGEGRIEL